MQSHQHRIQEDQVARQHETSTQSYRAKNVPSNSRMTLRDALSTTILPLLSEEHASQS